MADTTGTWLSKSGYNRAGTAGGGNPPPHPTGQEAGSGEWPMIAPILVVTAVIKISRFNNQNG